MFEFHHRYQITLGYFLVIIVLIHMESHRDFMVEMAALGWWRLDQASHGWKWTNNPWKLVQHNLAARIDITETFVHGLA